MITVKKGRDASELTVHPRMDRNGRARFADFIDAV